jgi:NADPH2:quinone reductase
VRAVISSPDGAIVADQPVPEPGPGDVLVRVHAAALNRADLGMVRGGMHGRTGGMGLPLGLEWAGEIVEPGKDVTGWKTGDRVMATGGGAYAEYTLGTPGRMVAIPDGMSFETAATLPVALNTMHDAVVTHGQLQPGQSILIQGASSGVGLMAQQIAKFLGAGQVLGSSTNTARRARLTAFGADQAIDTSDPEWVTAVLDATGGKGVDVTIDQLSGSFANGNLQATRIGGRIVNVGRLAGEKAEFNFDLHALRRISYVGVTFRTRSAAEVERIVAGVRRDLYAAMAAGHLVLPVDRVFPLEETPEALRRMRRNEHFGKIVVAMD